MAAIALKTPSIPLNVCRKVQSDEDLACQLLHYSMRNWLSFGTDVLSQMATSWLERSDRWRALSAVNDRKLQSQANSY